MDAVRRLLNESDNHDYLNNDNKLNYRFLLDIKKRSETRRTSRELHILYWSLRKFEEIKISKGNLRFFFNIFIILIGSSPKPWQTTSVWKERAGPHSRLSIFLPPTQQALEIMVYRDILTSAKLLDCPLLTDSTGFLIYQVNNKQNYDMSTETSATSISLSGRRLNRMQKEAKWVQLYRAL